MGFQYFKTCKKALHIYRSKILRYICYSSVKWMIDSLHKHTLLTPHAFPIVIFIILRLYSTHTHRKRVLILFDDTSKNSESVIECLLICKGRSVSREVVKVDQQENKLDIFYTQDSLKCF